VGIWSSTVADQYVPYPRPQECGNKEEVRWLTLSRPDGTGLLVASETAPMSASALHFTAADLASVRHAYELNRKPEVILSLDAHQTGLGNSSCGPGVLQRYAVLPGDYQLNISFRPCESQSISTTATTSRTQYK